MITSYDLRLIEAITRNGSLKGAAAELGVTSSAISQKLSKLEEVLGLKLANRSGRAGLMLTAEGLWLAERSKDILTELATLESDVKDRIGIVSGNLKINASIELDRDLLALLALRFDRDHKKVNIAFDFVDPRYFPNLDECDVYFTTGDAADIEGFRKENLRSEEKVLCASPEYIAHRGEPSSPHDLRNHSLIAVASDSNNLIEWSFERPGRSPQHICITPSMKCNHGDVAKLWAIQRQGVVMQSLRSVESDLESGRLKRVLGDCKIPQAELWAYTALKSSKTLRVHIFLAYIKSALEDMAASETA